MKELILAKWDDILNILENVHGLSNILVNTWIKPLNIYSVEDNKVYFTVDEKFGEKAVGFLKRKNYDLYLETVLREMFQDNSLEVVITLESTLKKASMLPTYTDGYNEAIARSNLKPEYTFDTFIVGESNKHAHATCLAVADSPGQDKFNPLFLYGGSGLGKTHLMQSIAHYILQNNSNMKVLYVPSNKFTNEIVEAIKKNKTEEFRDKYRTVDVLLIDDIQYLIGKESTQQEFFDTFNALHDEGKQIILSSDKPPKEIKTLDERFRSRFEWGVPIDIHAPDYETRMAILKNKAEIKGLNNISEEIFEYIANNITYNVRELEGALNKLSVYSQLGDVKITEELAKNILKDFVSKDTKVTITPELIINTVSEHLNIPVNDIVSTKRSQDIATARQISMYLCRKYTDKGLKSIGDSFGGKDHSTVHSNIQKVEEKIEKDPEFAEVVDVIIKKLNPQK
jgi:chromosomal replication initiator protein